VAAALLAREEKVPHEDRDTNEMILERTANGRSMVPLSAARTEDPGPGDFVHVECLACRHDEIVAASGLLVGLRLPSARYLGEDRGEAIKAKLANTSVSYFTLVDIRTGLKCPCAGKEAPRERPRIWGSLAV